MIEEHTFLLDDLKESPANQREQALEAFREKQRASLMALHAKARTIAENQPRTPRPYVSEVMIPGDASPEMEELLVKRAEMQNERIRLENSLLDATPEEREAARRNFDEQALFKRKSMAELGAKAAAQTAAQPIPPVPELRIPPAAAPEVKAFLQERHRQMTERRTFEEGLRELPPHERDQARKGWDKQQFSRKAQLADLAKKASDPAR